MNFAACSTSIIVGRHVLPVGMVGMIEASTTRNPSTPRTRQDASTTASESTELPILQVPEGWKIGVT